VDLAHLREEYRRAHLDVGDVDPDPLAQFQRWFHEAQTAKVHEPNAMALATTDADGAPNVRMVLLKEATALGFVFFTDYRSVKGVELEGNARGALCFWWGALERQVRLRGPIAKISPEDRLLVETDSPFLAPVPHRGRMCEPAYVVDTASFVAGLRGTEVEQLTALTTANFFKLFSKARP
jgi:hypothetical protein